MNYVTTNEIDHFLYDEAVLREINDSGASFAEGLPSAHVALSRYNVLSFSRRQNVNILPTPVG